ncbi:pentatricopeptide repeat-containing protein At3g12770-like [Mangifera indica]|uniref:pentatricopeptide repeat-containing protein At3g12770-like n=1 Tax=Mangifera indica TaxID=29780 RepID=UPI001CFAD63E|nr:pentatricopeptide repeat-containing protein At3g12770-like [Mangifera indica]
MSSLFLHINHYIRKLPLKLIFTLTYSTSTFQYVHLNQASSVIHKFSSLLQQSSKTIILVKSIHAQIITNAVSTDQFLVTKLLKVYSQLGLLSHACYVFDKIPQPTVFLCNALVNGYVQNEKYKETLDLFRSMCSFDLDIDSYTCNFALKSCTALGDYEMGREIISIAFDKGINDNRFLGSSIIKFLVNFGDIDEARSVFNGMLEKDVVCWNSMIGGYVKACQYGKAFAMFLEMRKCRIMPSTVTMVSLFQACGGMRNIELGKCVHSCVLALGMGDDVLVLTSLVDMYSKLGDIIGARSVFDGITKKSLVSWNAIISGYVQNSSVNESFKLFCRLVASGGGCDSGTIVSLLHGCAQIADLESGKFLHCCIFRRGLELNPILSTAIVDFYLKCGALKQAKIVFHGMKDRNVITWTAMLVGLAQNGHAEDALKLFSRMQEEEVAANLVTLVSLVHACAHLGSLKNGKSIHAQFMRQGFAFDAVNMTAFIDMYAKCGKINSAEQVFNNGFISKDVILWNSMITGYGMHGHGHQALSLYRKMIEEGIRPNETSFIALLTACSHSGLVKEGKALFSSMERDHKISLTEKHYACLVDILSRAGHLEEAEALINQMPFTPSSAVFEALLSGCRTHKNIDMGMKTADKLLYLDAMNPGTYIMLSNIYAEARRWDAVNYIRGRMMNRGIRKTPGYSLIEVENQVHSFFAGDDSHPKWAEIYKFLENLRLQVEALGYVPETSCVLRNVDTPMKIKLLWMHSERLAIAFGLLSTPVGSSIRITKNLRVCADCHSVTKYISKIVKRDIIVRDTNRFHHFADGNCSCNDYW